MKLYLQRHCEPVPGHPMDSTRGLNADGRIEATQMAQWLKDDIGRVDIVVSSPFDRCRQTAEIMADALGADVVTTTLLAEELDPEQIDPQKIWEEVQRIAQQSEHVLIVTHHEILLPFVNWLIGGGLMRFEWGSIAHVKSQTSVLEAFPRVCGCLHWFVSPKLVEKELGEQEVAEAARELVASIAK